MSILKKPDLSDPKLRAKLAKGMGHNYYGEPAWPNDLLYIFPVCILGTISCCIGLGVLEPTPLGERADPFATPLEILPNGISSLHLTYFVLFLTNYLEYFQWQLYQLV